MLILALSDIHGEVDALSDTLSRTPEVDLVLVAGDFTEFGGASELGEVLEAFGEARSRLVAVPGNCDRRTARERLAGLGLSADGRLVERSGVLVAGVGGGLLRTGLTPYERHDEELASGLRASLDEGASRAQDGSPLVVLSHQPPKDSGADMRRGVAVGSRALRAVLDSARPVLWVCGHIHESPCAQLVGGSLVVNPGAAKDGRYALVSLERDGAGAWSARIRD